MSLVEAIEHDEVQTESPHGEMWCSKPTVWIPRLSGNPLECGTKEGDSPVRVSQGILVVS